MVLKWASVRDRAFRGYSHLAESLQVFEEVRYDKRTSGRSCWVVCFVGCQVFLGNSQLKEKTTICEAAFTKLLAGVDFKLKMLTLGGKRIKLTIWDTGLYSFSRPHFWRWKATTLLVIRQHCRQHLLRWLWIWMLKKFHTKTSKCLRMWLNTAGLGEIHCC